MAGFRPNGWQHTINGKPTPSFTLPANALRRIGGDLSSLEDDYIVGFIDVAAFHRRYPEYFSHHHVNPDKLKLDGQQRINRNYQSRTDKDQPLKMAEFYQPADRAFSI